MTILPFRFLLSLVYTSLDVGEWEPEGTDECGARVWCPDLLHEGQWHHIAIVLNRAVLKNSSFSLYLDGQQIYSQKVTFIFDTRQDIKR